jgi:hypothetical protein
MDAPPVFQARVFHICRCDEAFLLRLPLFAFYWCQHVGPIRPAVFGDDVSSRAARRDERPPGSSTSRLLHRAPPLTWRLKAEKAQVLALDALTTPLSQLPWGLALNTRSAWWDPVSSASLGRVLLVAAEG